jgi:tetratricopeptide (TPR) repeat protein
VLNYLGYSWVDMGMNLDEARDMLDRAVALRPDDGFIVDSVGWVHYRLGEYPQAVESLERAVELEPGDPVINDHLGDAYWRVGREREARYQWQRALTLEPDDELIEAIEEKLRSGLPPPDRA